MEKNIIHHLLFSCNSLDEQIEAVKKLRMVPENFYDKDTKMVLKAIEFSHNMNRIADEKAINTFFRFNKVKFDIDDYFWDTDEIESKNIILKSACDLFVKQKEIEINKELLADALSKYEKTGDLNVINRLELASSERRNGVKDIKKATELGLKKLDLIRKKMDTKSVKFSKSFFFMEMILKGLEPGELIIMAARPGVGKTAFGLAFLNDFSKQGKRSMYVTLEMSAEELTERMLIAKTSIPRATFFSQTGFTEEKFKELEKAADELNKQPIVIVDEAPGTFLEIKEIIKEEHKKNPLDVIFIDYLGLIGSYSGDDNFNVRDTVSKISRGCKLLAMELKLPVILIQQVNRNAASGHRDDSSFKELQLTDLRDSGSLEQDANKVFLLWNQEPKDEKEKQEMLDFKYKVILDIAKNRNGQSNQKVLFEFNKTFQRIKEIDWITKPSTWGKRND